MQKILYFLFALSVVCGAHEASASDRAGEILRGLAAHVRGLGGYAVDFSVDTGAGATRGSYAVSGDNYYLQLGEAEVYGVGMVRYEVNNRMREVTIDKVDDASRNILNNPTRAFDLVGDEYTTTLLWERDGQAAVKLTPKSAQGVSSVMTVTVDTRRMEPRTLSYDFDGDRITISVQSMAVNKIPLKRFDQKGYAGYEIIDFR